MTGHTTDTAGMTDTADVPGTAKAFTNGTHRVRHPRETWSIIEPKLARFGITRVADVTGLDSIGIPVAMAIRPMAATVSVSQGKGRTRTLSKVSAAMEGIELWHAERSRPALAHRGVPAGSLPLPYRLRDLDTMPGSLVGAATPLDWIAARGLVGGGATVVPRDAVCFTSVDDRRWRPPGFRTNTNGLASGNSVAEAALHGLYEIVERDALTGTPPGQSYVDPGSVEDEACRELIERVLSADAVLEIVRLPSRFGVPCFTVQIWSQDLPLTCLGAGAHSSTSVALSRALTEAAQSRLTAIAGTRDDIGPLYERVRDIGSAPPKAPEVLSPLGAEADESFDDVERELAWLCARAAAVTGHEPLLVDLSTDDEFAVVKVLLPGAGLDLRRVHPGHDRPTRA
ncbi:YcaO-like family protein [Streptomyces sp. UNOC14_S4]|uniref:YcaO-like family protein n=1 Tax=Streptomyces sp. UNOC14_S4 TaxID=2872340 RepID=UPI001E2CDF50|nr:YcaO-like family protein [Streptomyces sp. UNOC14_S4]MCC3768801.1 YcaO-like family protein [Streptomyces sp. UNOC14_S4]